MDNGTPSLSFNDSDAAYETLAEHVERFITAWQAEQEPPLLDYVPPGSAALRRLCLIELIKVDLEHRQERGCLRPLGEYFDTFPELCDGAEVPFDLIYEDFHIRKQGGETVVIQPYFDRFPDHRTRLEQILGVGGEGYHSMRALATSVAMDVGVGQQLDDFDLIKDLGAGAFAKVFLARQLSMQRFVALKVSADQSDEPQTLAQLDHPHIVRVYDQRVVTDRHLRLLYMQYIPGGTLHDVIKAVQQRPDQRSGKMVLEVIDGFFGAPGELLPSESFAHRLLNDLTWAQAVCRIGASVAAVLDFAHRRGVLHRDVKPANVLLTAEGSPKLADFNISFSSQVEGASPGEFFGGSLAYMSPEQLEAYDPNHVRQPEEMDGRSDIYSLGVLLWEMFAGSRPFDDQMLPQGIEATIRDMTLRRRRGLPPEKVERLTADWPQGLKCILLKCLAPDPADRFAHAGQLSRQLELCLSDAHDLLYPPTVDHWRTVAARWPLGQMLLAVTPRSWKQTAARWPLWSIVIAGLLPNLLLSWLNIRYNGSAIIKMFGEENVESLFRNKQLFYVNSVVYPIGILTLGYWFWPIRQAVLKRNQGQLLSLDEWRLAGRRRLWLGQVASRVSLALWLSTSLVFPAWIEIANPDISVSPYEYVHFIGSQLFCGLIAASLTYFLIAYVATRVLYPRLIASDLDDMFAVDQLVRARRPVVVHFFVLAAVPVLSLSMPYLLKTLGAEGIESITVQQGVPSSFFFLGMIGLAGMAFCWWLGQKIHSDLAALRPAVCQTISEVAREVEAILLGSTRRAGLTESARTGTR